MLTQFKYLAFISFFLFSYKVFCQDEDTMVILLNSDSLQKEQIQALEFKNRRLQSKFKLVIQEKEKEIDSLENELLLLIREVRFLTEQVRASKISLEEVKDDSGKLFQEMMLDRHKIRSLTLVLFCALLSFVLAGFFYMLFYMRKVRRANEMRFSSLRKYTNIHVEEARIQLGEQVRSRLKKLRKKNMKQMKKLQSFVIEELGHSDKKKTTRRKKK